MREYVLSRPPGAVPGKLLSQSNLRSSTALPRASSRDGGRAPRGFETYVLLLYVLLWVPGGSAMPVG